MLTDYHAKLFANELLRRLLDCCGSFTVNARDALDSLMIKKTPKAVLKRCEWGRDDYSLRVENLPKAPPKPGQMELFPEFEGVGQ